MTYRHLDPDKIADTLESLFQRITERFPHSGIVNVAKELLKTGQEAKERSRWVVKPLWHLRIFAWLLAGLIAASLMLVVLRLDLREHPLTIVQFIQAVESGINDIVFLSIGVFFLLTLEIRIKRGRVLPLLHELRAMAHVIDMHQLTKDPESLLNTYQQTKSSPSRTMTAFELQRYLDYCTEMLSGISKIAALYVQDFPDAQIVDLVNDIESLTTGLSRKIWQKISILQTFSQNKNP